MHTQKTLRYKNAQTKEKTTQQLHYRKYTLLCTRYIVQGKYPIYSCMFLYCLSLFSYIATFAQHECCAYVHFCSQVASRGVLLYSDFGYLHARIDVLSKF